MGVTQPVDSSILHEIVRIVDARRKVPERVVVRGREYQITYLEDHQRRLEEALQRFDNDRLNMLYGQLASKVKYQLLRRVPQRAAAPKPAVKKAATPRSAVRVAKPKRASKVSAKRSAKPRSRSKPAGSAKTAKGSRAAAKKATARTGRAARKKAGKKK